MDIYKASAIAEKMPHSKGLYDKVARFFRGDRKGLSKPELMVMKKVVTQQHKNLVAAIDEQIKIVK